MLFSLYTSKQVWKKCFSLYTCSYRWKICCFLSIHAVSCEKRVVLALHISAVSREKHGIFSIPPFTCEKRAILCAPATKRKTRANLYLQSAVKHVLDWSFTCVTAHLKEQLLKYMQLLYFCSGLCQPQNPFWEYLVVWFRILANLEIFGMFLFLRKIIWKFWTIST